MGKRILLALAMLFACRGVLQADAQQVLEVFPQLGHSRGVGAAVFSPDGRLLASAGQDSTVKLWDVASGRELRALRGYSGFAFALTFSRDGTILASGDGDQTLVTWDVASGHLLQTFKADDDDTYAVAISPDRRLLASGGDGQTITLWDKASGHKLNTLRGHAGSVLSLAFSPDGRLIASGSADKTIGLWDVASGRELRSFTGHTSDVYTIAFSRDGRQLISSSRDHTTKFWNIADGRELRTITGDSGDFIASSRDGKLLASGSNDGTIKLWDAQTGHQVGSLRGLRGSVGCVDFSPDGKTLSSCFSDKSIVLWNYTNGRILHTIRSMASAIDSMAVSSDGQTVASGGDDGTIKLWDVSSGRKLNSFRGHELRIQSVAFSPDGKLLASGSDDGTVKVWEPFGGRNRLTLSGHTLGVSSVAFSKDGKTLASGSGDGTIRIWDAASGRPIRTLAVPQFSGAPLTTAETAFRMGINAIAFSPGGDGKVLASGGFWGVATLWDTTSDDVLDRMLMKFNGHALGMTPAPGIASVAFSSDGKTLATGGFDGTARLWNTVSGQPVRTLNGHAGTVNSVAFSPDGTVLASGTSDGSIALWDVASGVQLRRLDGNTDSVSSIAFGAGGKLLVSGGGDGTIRTWDVATGRERVALVAFEDGSSIAIAPEGYFDASSRDAEQNLNVRIGNRVLGIASFREKFFKPDLVKASMEGQPLTQLGDAGGEGLPPFVDVTELPASTNSPRINLKVHLVADGGGIGTVRLFLNGAAVRQDFTPPAKGEVSRSYSVPLVNGANEISAVGFNADGTVQSNDATTFVNAKLPPSQPVLHAVIVGIEHFKNPEYDLKQSIRDAQYFEQTLEAYAGPKYGKLDIVPLLTPDLSDKRHIVDTLKAMQPSVGPDDVFVFYFASHGEVGDDGKYYLITSNVSSIDKLATEALSSQELAGLLANIAATRKLVLLDACHSQKAGDEMLLALADQGMNAGTAATILSRGTGLTSLSASATNQEAKEGVPETDNHSLFTYVLVKGLTGKPGTSVKAIAGKGGAVDTFALADYVDTEVPLLATALRSDTPQQPTVAKSGVSFPVTQVH